MILIARKVVKNAIKPVIMFSPLQGRVLYHKAEKVSQVSHDVENTAISFLIKHQGT